MYKIVNAELEDVSVIANFLSEHFKACNASIGMDVYFSDKERMTKHLQKRISDSDSLFSYHIAVDETGEKKGFINLLKDFDSKRGEILIMGTFDSQFNKGIYDTLYDFSMQYFKQNRMNQIYAEAVVHETDIAKYLQDKKMAILSTKYVAFTS